MAVRDPALHKNHRKRVKEQFRKNGTDSMNDHQFLEFLLYYAIPQGDTNELAHRLINECGSLVSVFEADYDRLLGIKGVGEHTASLLKLIPHAASRYLSAVYGSKIVSTPAELSHIKDYFMSLFLGTSAEGIYAAALGSDMKLVHAGKLADGDAGKVGLDPRRIVNFMNECRCDNIVIAHNHPHASFLPSLNDVFVTEDVAELLERLDIHLLDHIIIGDTGAYSMRESMYAKRIWKEES